MSALSINQTGATISTSGTSAAADIPNDAAGNNPRYVRVAATAAAYVKLGSGGGATATSRLKALSAAVNTAGSGYAVDDTITLTGGTATEDIVLIVTGETGGAIDTVDVQTAGVYSAIPSNPVSQGATSGGGSGADFNITWGVDSVVVSAGGASYKAAPAVSFSGGGGATATAAVTDGAVTAVTVTDAGTGYTSAPTVSFAETTTAAAGDVLVQPGDAVVLNTSLASRIAAIQVSTGGVVQVSPCEDSRL